MSLDSNKDPTLFLHRTDALFCEEYMLDDEKKPIDRRHRVSLYYVSDQNICARIGQCVNVIFPLLVQESLSLSLLRHSINEPTGNLGMLIPLPHALITQVSHTKGEVIQFHIHSLSSVFSTVVFTLIPAFSDSGEGKLWQITQVMVFQIKQYQIDYTTPKISCPVCPDLMNKGLETIPSKKRNRGSESEAEEAESESEAEESEVEESEAEESEAEESEAEVEVEAEAEAEAEAEESEAEFIPFL